MMSLLELSLIVSIVLSYLRSCSTAEGINCDFEQDTCLWKQDDKDDFDWRRMRGSTSSYYTGPSGDHTTRTGYYMYIEATSRKDKDSANLISNYLSGTPGKCLRFWYHMYGQDINTLNVFTDTGSIRSIAWSISGTQGNVWKEGTVNIISSSPFKIIFEGLRGKSYQGDIAIDDVSLTDGTCNCVNSTDKWPEGSYGLSKPTTGCPESNWWEGYRYQNLESDNDANTKWSYPIHLHGPFTKTSVYQRFCMHVSNSGKSWPKGNYCIYKFGKLCPLGFLEGWIYWDDEDTKNKNDAETPLPAGRYDDDTKIYFCCRNDGNISESIILPTDRPFYLFKSKKSNRCQFVSGMRSRLEWILFDTEDSDNADEWGGEIPDVDTSSSSYLKMYFCYYYH